MPTPAERIAAAEEAKTPAALISAESQARMAELLSRALPDLPRPDYEVWLLAFLARSPGTRKAATNAAYADEAVSLYRDRL